MADMADIKELHRFYESQFDRDPSMDCIYDKEHKIILIKRSMSFDNNLNTFVSRSDDEGYIFTSMPMPPIKVPEERIGNVQKYLNTRNLHFKRGCFSIDKDGELHFSNFIRLGPGDVISERSMIQETMLGMRMMIFYIPQILDICDGKEVEEEETESSNESSSDNTKIEGEDERYVAASNEKTRETTGVMYG